MRHIAAYLLAVLGGNASPSAADVKNILSSVGVDADEERLTALLKELDGKDINEIMTNGTGKLAKFGGGGGAVAAAGGAAAAGGDGAATEDAKKEESEEEEADLGGGMDMFGGGDDY